MSLKDRLHEKFLEKSDVIEKWFEKQIKSEDYPFYCSFDIRESENKLAPVDANLFPAGFNNICQADREVMGDLLDRCLNFKDLNIKNVGIFCEEHTQNPYYWDNVLALKNMFEERGMSVSVLLPNLEHRGAKMESASGAILEVSEFELKEGQVCVDGKNLDFVLSNNDFSTAYESWISEMSTRSLPPLKMGWHKRRKSSFFKIYNEVVEDFCGELGIDPFLLRVETQSFEDFVIEDKESLKRLSEEVDEFQKRLRSTYEERGLKEKPYVFVKNSYGTYGLGVLEVKTADDIASWNYKSRKKMKATKGGKGVSSLIIQEGIPTSLFVNEAAAEAVIYLVGCGLAGGFLRTHAKKTGSDSLNAPGAVFKRMCFSDYEFQIENRALENVYGTVARLGALALSREIEASK